MAKVKEVKTVNSRETMAAVKNMVEFMKEEVDKAVLKLSLDNKIERSNSESVSLLIKSTIESSFVRAAGTIQKTVE